MIHKFKIGDKVQIRRNGIESGPYCIRVIKSYYIDNKVPCFEFEDHPGYYYRWERDNPFSIELYENIFIRIIKRHNI